MPVALEDPCLVMYTSGTTGRPKGAVLTHGNMTWNAVNQFMGMEFGADERTLALAPLFHIGGLNGTVNPTLLRGGCAVVVRRFDPAATLAVIEEQRVSSFFAVPTMLDAMSREPGFPTRDLSALRTIGAAGAPLPLPTLRTWLDRGVTVQQCYGMTEAAPGCTVLDSADAVRKVGSAGKPVFFTDLRVVAPRRQRRRRRRGRRGARVRAPTSWPATGGSPSGPPRCSSTAGTTPGTPARSTTRASSPSATASRT